MMIVVDIGELFSVGDCFLRYRLPMAGSSGGCPGSSISGAGVSGGSGGSCGA
jgi:hypothetical protein